MRSSSVFQSFLALLLVGTHSINAVAAAPAAAESVSTVTASFWNLQWFPGRRPNANRTEETRQIRAVQADIAQMNPDIVGLEEVRDSEHAALAVLPLTGFKVDVCSNFSFRKDQKESQQIAIASRLQPIAAWAESWKRGSAVLPPRGFAFAAYRVASDRVLLVYALHLKSNRGEVHEDMRIREESMRQLLSHLKAMNERFGKNTSVTWIIGGDFNTAPDEPRFAKERTISSLRSSGFKWTGEGVPFSARITMPNASMYPAAAFDQIFYRGATLDRVWVTHTSRHSSDHRPINALLNLE